MKPKQVEINLLVKVRFSDKKELVIRVYDETMLPSLGEFPINKNTPLAKAIIGHHEGDTVEYYVGKSKNSLKILEIYDFY